MHTIWPFALANILVLFFMRDLFPQVSLHGSLQEAPVTVGAPAHLVILLVFCGISGWIKSHSNFMPALGFDNLVNALHFSYFRSCSCCLLEAAAG